MFGWKTYLKGSDPAPLVESLRQKNTGWCTAGETTAAQQLQGGDFHVYYSKDQDGNFTIPRIAIRMEGSEIAEVRGVAKGQHLDSKMAGTNILENKLQEFGAQGLKYKKRSKDMTQLTQIESYIKQGTEPSLEDLTFLYELEGSIDGFGRGADPRIREILQIRNPRKDLASIFNAKESEIALTPEEALLDQAKYATNTVLFETLKMYPDNVQVIEKLIHARSQTTSSEFKDTALIKASQQGHLQVAKILLQYGASKDASNNYADTALMEAAQSGHLQIVKLLLEHKVNVNAHNNHKYTALIKASTGQNLQIVRLLLKHGADVNTATSHGTTALIEASQAGNLQIVELLLEHKANIHAGNKNNQTALIVAAAKGHTKVIETLIKQGADINHLKGLALALALHEQHPETAEKLMEYNINVNAANHKGTALMWASSRGYTEIVKELIKRGADTNLKHSLRGNTALIFAAEGGQAEITELLLRAGADPNFKNQNGATALMIASSNQREEAHILAEKIKIIKLLIANRALVDSVNNQGETALRWAAVSGFLEAIDILSEAGANLESKTEGGATPLMQVATYNHKDSLLKLLEKGALIDALNNNGETALISAIREKHDRSALVLIGQGANIHIQDHQGKTALTWALMNGLKDIEKKLIEKGARY